MEKPITHLNEKKFKIGDIVSLKSGSPKMTVLGYLQYLAKGSFTEYEDSNTEVECEYYSEKEGRFLKKSFHQDTLLKVD